MYSRYYRAKQFLIKPLTHLIINSSFVSEIFPNTLKISKIRKLHKKGDENYPSNYRSLSIFPVISKIYEHDVHSRNIVDFLDTNSMFDDEQYGFRSGRSVSTAGIDLVETIIDAVYTGENIVAILFILVKSLTVYLIQYYNQPCKDLVLLVSLKWFQSYLDNRSHCRNSSSQWL